MNPASASGGGARLVSLDAFRGMTIAGMILVNNPGSWSNVYWPLLHAAWHGWTPTDLIFPFFLFILGVSMILSFRVRTQRGATRAELLKHVLRRSAIVFGLGLFLAAFPFFRFSTLRIPGVLQRIAVCYLLASLVALATGLRGRVTAIGGLLFGYWAVMTLVPVPGYGTGRLDVEANLAAYVDRWLMLGHLWKPTWDPEGLLSTFPAVATTLIGTLVGQWILWDGPALAEGFRLGRDGALRPAGGPKRAKAVGMLAMGAAGLAIGQLWHFWFPINKNLWTSSYVVFAAGFAIVLLAVSYWAVEVQGYRRWATPFLILGANSIASFTASSLMAKMMGIWKVPLPSGRLVPVKAYLYLQFFAPVASPKNASLLFALSYVVFWLAVMGLLYRRKIFIKI